MFSVSLLCSAGGIDWSTIRLPPAGSSRPPKPPAAAAARSPDSEDPETIRQTFLSDPHQMSLLKERNPRLADVINSSQDFAKVKGKG